MSKSQEAKKVLFVGQQPETVDFTDPALPPGFDATKINAGIALGMKQMADRGWYADLCLVRPDESATTVLEQQLSTVSYEHERVHPRVDALPSPPRFIASCPHPLLF